MDECSKREENLAQCPCPSDDCERKGRCCECVATHRAAGNLPVCLRDLASE